MLRPPHSLIFGTFGIYRWLLASAVVVCHLAPRDFRYVGFYSVFAFFCLSGYIVSYILNTSYFHLRHGVKKYFLNRSLRIFPLYWLSIFISWLMLLKAGSGLGVHGLYQMPDTNLNWLINIVTIGATDLNGTYNDHLLNPSGWSLGVELTFWILIPLLWKYKNIFALFITLTCIFLAIGLIDGREMLAIRYESPLGSAVPFMLGMFIYARKAAGHKPLPHWVGYGTFVFLLILYIFSYWLFADPYFEGFYLALAANAVFIAFLSDIPSERMPERVRRIDGFLGTLAYPIFLVHLPAGLALYMIDPDIHVHTWAFCLIVLVFSNIIAVILHAYVETPVDRLRKKLKC